jgi:hypothetical protein
VIPDLRQPGHKAAWYRLEVAKRRLLYSLLHLELPLTPKSDDPAHGLAYDFCILSTLAIDKLRFIHETIAAASHAVC